eukprot:GDKJ01032401.1.p1 GENE.GDKJ01032401.1~~GDKJ01032401.1.p1  ORF type:complete len:388 (-),score=41.06 GDKJ01032401.1:146-1309(-)
MNTRLQVEHTITELITGVDLVEQMIRAAAGLKLSIKQEDIHINGWATEARVYAEDPMKKYFPSIGRLTQYEEPVGEGVRVDSGIVEGSQISVYYDPLIAKLCTWGPTRDVCLDRMRGALDNYVIRGLKHNVCLLRDVISQERYIKGDITTNYLPETYPEGFKKAPLQDNEYKRLLATSCILSMLRTCNINLSGKPNQAPRKIEGTYYGSLGIAREHETAFNIKQTSANTYAVDIVADGSVQESAPFTVDWKLDHPVITVTAKGFGSTGATPDVMQLFGTDEVSYQIQYHGTVFTVNALSELQAKVMPFIPATKVAAKAKELLSPMPGVIVHMNVKEGDAVVMGTELVTLEAMKMRNKLRSEVDGKVKSIKVNVGDKVEDEQVIIEFE